MNTPTSPQLLAHYAAHSGNSRGRVHDEDAPLNRTEFQRDRDRIIHSAAFRRLEYKTQVFVNHEGDLFRTRLTHTIEVSQIARSVARALKLNEDLTEAIALAHDLGHTPFGHAGQHILNECMAAHGGFEHNLQSLRVVERLEEKYAEFPGLNLTYETREGILKHCTTDNAKNLGPIGERFIKHTQPSLEAQLCDLTDQIAYNSHDVDDGLRAGLISVDQLRQIALFNEQYETVHKSYPDLSQRRTIHEVVRRIINSQVTDLIQTSDQLLAEASPATIEDVRNHHATLIRFSAKMQGQNQELKNFLREALYRHYRVHRMSLKASQIVKSMFNAFMNDSRLLPPEPNHTLKQMEERKGLRGRARAIADYIAGMTDRYAIAEHRRLFDPTDTT